MRTFTIYLAPVPHSSNTRRARHLWYALSDGSGAPPLYFGLGPAPTPSPFAANYRCGDGEANYLDPNLDHPIMVRTVAISKKEFELIKRFGEDICN